jgi:hypothetical protein
LRHQFALSKGKIKEMNLKLSILIFVSAIFFTACFKTPEYPIEPTVKFESYDKPGDVFTLGETGNMVISFTDGDGDLGKATNQDSSSRVYYRNQKDTAFFKENYYIIPNIPAKGTTNAISGTLEIKLSEALFNSYETYFIFKGKTIDTFTYKLYITDRANHVSNMITTPPIIVKYQ